MGELKHLKSKIFQTSRPVELTLDTSMVFDKEGYYVPMGWGDDFDKTFNFRQGSLAVGIVPTGVGKTTSTIVTACHNFLQGRNVLVIFFEDDYSDLFKKIYSKLSGVKISDLKSNFDMVKDIAQSSIIRGQEKGGHLVMLKMSQSKTTTNDIRNVLDYFMATYGNLDLLVLDYLDCVKSSFNKKYNDDNYEEQGDVIVDIMEMVSDLEYFIPCLTYIQSNRGGLNAALVSAGNASGSIKRIFKAPQVFTISRTIGQKSKFKANVLIEKNRKGESGIFFRDVEFDNARVSINISNSHIEEVLDNQS
jgi:replicative DNA helicase